MHKITSKVLDYLKDSLPNFQKKGVMFTCPICLEVKCNIITNTNRIFCIKCRKPIGDIFDVVNILEPNKYKSKDEVIQYLKKKYDIDYFTETDINKVFSLYESFGFDLVPIVGNTKIPLEKDWLNKQHITSSEWLDWYSDNLNMGVKSGEKSGVTVLDFDIKEISSEIKPLLNETLLAETDRGWHYIYKYEPSLSTTRIDELKLDLINNGKQFVIYPSKVNGIRRKELIGTIINKMSPELIEYLKKRNKVDFDFMSPAEKLDESIKSNILNEVNFNLVGEGNRNTFLLHLGGILRKEMSSVEVEKTLGVVNRICCKPPYPQKELKILVDSLDKYVVYDEKELALKILKHLRIVKEATARDLKEVVLATKEKVDTALAFLEREGYIIRKSRMYHVLTRVDWKDTFADDCKPIDDFKVPYFHDVANFVYSDMILIGGKQKVGKTHIAINIIKQLVEQGKKPYYLNLEGGNRWVKISKQLGLKEGDFFNFTNFSPEGLELEDNAITIIDWLLPKDYANTDKLFQHFAEQLFKHKGLLIVFVQLRDTDSFFAKDMVAMFPAFVCRYIYEKDGEGKDVSDKGAFHVDYVRDAKPKSKTFLIPCQYNWNTKRLTRTDELDLRTDHHIETIPIIPTKKNETEEQITENTVLEMNEQTELFIKEKLSE